MHQPHLHFWLQILGLLIVGTFGTAPLHQIQLHGVEGVPNTPIPPHSGAATANSMNIGSKSMDLVVILKGCSRNLFFNILMEWGKITHQYITPHIFWYCFVPNRRSLSFTHPACCLFLQCNNRHHHLGSHRMDLCSGLRLPTAVAVVELEVLCHKARAQHDA